MADTVVKNVTDIAPYEGPNQIAGIRFRPARRALGVTAWGMNVIELDPHCEAYPEHDHAHDGQEEVYVVLEGSAELHADGATTQVRQGDLVCVPPSVTRKFVTRDATVRLLAIGGTPGQAYEVGAM